MSTRQCINLNVMAVLAMLALIAGCVGVKSADKRQRLTAPPAPYKTAKAGNVVKAEPVLRENGIFCGDKGLIVHKSGKLTLMAGDKLGEFYIYFSTSNSPWITTNYRGFENEKVERNLKDREFIYTAVFPLAPKGTENMPYGKYLQRVKVTDDNKINISYEYSVPEGLEKNIKDTCLFFSMPFGVGASRKCEIDGKTYEFSAKAGGRKDIYADKIAKTFVFNPGNPETEFSIDMGSGIFLRVEEIKENIDLRFWSNKEFWRKKCSFTLDLSKVSESSLVNSNDFQAGIDFWKCDRLHVPDYNKCRNLIQNPSFEAGLRYYAYPAVGVYRKTEFDRLVLTDSQQSKFGHSSLLMRVFTNCWVSLQTFAMPVSPGKKYTVSIYTKGDQPNLQLQLSVIGGEWLPATGWFKMGQCTPTAEWKRYSFSFTAPDNALSVEIGQKGGKLDGYGNIWIDGLQVEEGEQATDYVEKPLNSILLTSNPDNFLSVDDKKVDARLKITAPSNTAGKVTCGIEDFFYRKIWEQSFDFKTDANGRAVVNLPIENLLGKGIYVVRADFELSGGYKDTDYYRISRMEFLKNTHKNKDIFATYRDWTRNGSRGRDVLKRLRDIGFGSVNYGPKNLNKEYFDGITEYGISYNGACMLDLSESKAITDNGKVLIEGFRAIESVSPELEKKLEDACYEKAKAYPWVNSWELDSEMECGFELIKKNNFKDFAKLEIAFYKGVKRFDPNKKAYLGGSCNMQPQNGTRFVDQYLAAVNGAVKFDGVTIHPYRTTPENPDLDDDAAVFFAMLDKHGYHDVPAYWEEGIYYTYYNIPAWGLDPHKGCSTDSYSAGCPSYHMGWGERISAAYFARSWLVALKYQDRVKAFNGWCSWLDMDAYLTPLALQKIPNTLGILLGNAVFKKDIRFAPETRCYVFEDEKQRPIAALWSHNPKVDRGYKESPVARLNFEGKTFEIIDLMENERSVKSDAKGFTDVPVTPFPVFIRGKAGELASLCKTIQNGRIIDSDKAVVRITAKPSNASELEVEFRNLVTREFQGQADIKLQDKVIEKKIRLKEKGAENVIIPMPEKIPFDRIAEIKLPVTLTEEGVKPLAVDLSFNAFAVKKLKGKIAVAGNADDWKDIPVIHITNRCISTTKGRGGPRTLPLDNNPEKVGYKGDHEAEYQMAWDDDNLYLRVNVTDDKFFHDPNPKGDVGGRWYNDSLQVYIDTLCDARNMKDTRGFDGNDYNYDFFPNEDGTLTAFRRFAPEQQQAGGLLAPKPNMVEPEVKGTFRKTEKGYIYEIALPKRLIAPLQLMAGGVSGFAIFINDHDGNYVKSALTTTPPGTGGYMNPHLYPVMILVE